MANHAHNPTAALVVGGGIAGMRAALDMADAGLKVFLVEHTPCLGGRVAQLGFMFPQHDCVLCRGTADHGHGCTRPSISPAFNSHNPHPNIEILTNTHVVNVEGEAGDFTVSVRQEPRYVDPLRCINCGYCTQVCPVELMDSYQLGMTKRKAVYKVAARAAPDAYVVDRGPYCDDCALCSEVCPTQAIDLGEQPRARDLQVGAIILALGFKSYDPSPLEELGYGRYANVIDAMKYERIASRSGPTEGMVKRPSDGAQPRSIAWLQCVGSRDQQNSFCSSICCMYATKEATLAKQRLGEDVDCSVFIMDERAFNKEYSAYFERARGEHGIQYIRSRISSIQEDSATGNLILHYATGDGELREESFEMVVLATGVQPPDSAAHFADMLDLQLNEYGFCETHKFSPLQTSCPGVFACGAFSSPKEISETILEASGAAGEVLRLLNPHSYSCQYTREEPFLTSDNLPPERDVSSEDPRIGVFVCSCGDTLNEALDISDIANEAATWSDVVYSEAIDLACLPDRIAHIQSRIVNEGMNRVVIAGCSSRTHESLFQRAVRYEGLNPYFLEMVNLRDHCAAVHAKQRGPANKKAVELVRVAVGRAGVAKPLKKQAFAVRASALVIGGGLSGMTSALAIADSGYDVHLVERASCLGGHLKELYYVAEGEDPQRLARDLISRVRNHERIRVYTNTELVAHEGHAGCFEAELRTHREDGRVEYHHVEHGATIIATGGREVREHPWLNLSGVITMEDLEEQAVHHPQRFAALEDVVMIQCVQPEGMAPYCSRVCCTNTLKNAIRLKVTNPACRVTVLYKNIVTYGFREKYFNEARSLGVIFSRYTDELPPEIVLEDGRLSVRYLDLNLKRWMTIPTDVVPLSMSIAPAEGTNSLAKLLRLPLSTEGFFAEAQIKLRPMDFTREGIFLAGMAHYPKFIEESISHSLAAAARAVTLLSQGTLHLGGVVAEVDPDKCVGCLTCVRVCPYGIPQVIVEANRSGVGALGGAAYIDPAQCQGCGTCTADCPANAIQLRHFTDEQMMLRHFNGLGSWMPWREINSH